MDEWETVIKGYQDSNDAKNFAKVLKSAEIVFAEDLASFETEWILATLLHKPIKLLDKVSENRLNNDWSKHIISSLKLLTVIVTKYETANKYYEEIVTLCLLPYDAQTRQQALSCLTSLVPRTSLAARDLNQHLLALEMATTCKAPLALLIGAICEHHPDIVEAEMTNIWRVFLNLLDSNKNTVTVVKAVLEGIMGLFKYFEMELPTMELFVFYDKLVSFLDLPRCENTVLVLLQRHAEVFRERVCADGRVRAAARARAGVRAGRAALRALHAAAGELPQKIISTEIEPCTKSQHYYEKFTALYVLMDIHKLRGFGDLNEYIDIQALEFDIRHGNINYETCEAILWCVQANLVFSDSLLQTAIMFYDKFVELKRKEVVIHALLLADKEVRNAAVIFLISEVCRAPSQPQYQQLWRDLFNSSDKTDAVMTEYGHYIVDDVLDHVSGVLQGLGDENISIDHYLEDDDRLQCALALLDVADGPYRDSEMVIALEIIFSSHEVEPSVLSKALNVLDKVVQKSDSDQTRLNKIIRQVENRAKRIDRTKKDERILYRDIIMFLGKYGRRDSNNTNWDNILIARLKNRISLELPYANTTLKINLQGVLQAAFEREDVEACKILCTVICANLAVKKDELLQSVLIRVLVSLSHFAVDNSFVLSAVSTCDASCAQELIGYIIREKSNRSRRILLGALEVLLKSEADDLLLQSVVESVIYYDDLKCNKQSILAIIAKLLELVKDNNLLCKKYLPEIVVKVLKYQDKSLIEIVTDIFKNKIELFDEDVLIETTNKIFQILNLLNNKMADASIKMAVTFVKDILEAKKDFRVTLEYYLTVEGVSLTVLVILKQVYNYDYNTKKILIDNFQDKLFACNNFDEDESLFDFLAEYIDVLLDVDSVGTYNLLSRAIKKLKPDLIVSKKNKLSKCLSTLKSTKMYEPIIIKTSLDSIMESLPVKKISECIENYSFETKHEVFIKTLNILLISYDWDDGPILMEFSRYIRQWLGLLMKLHSTGYIERCLKSKLEYLTDLVEVSLKFYNDEELISLVLKDDEKSGVTFLSTFMSATFKYLIKKPYALLLAAIKQSCGLLNDVVKYAARRDRGGEVVELVDVLWPTYAAISSFDEKHSLLLQVSSKLPSNSNPMRWVGATIKGGSLVEKIKLVAFIDDEYIIRSALCPHLRPLREAGARAGAALRAALRALAACARAAPAAGLLDLVATLVDGDSTKGWWDDAIDMCMSTLAARADMRFLQCVYSRTFRGRGAGVCERLMVPLLRYVKPSLCEEFMSSILSELFSLLKMTPRAVVNHYSYEKCVMDYVRAFNIILVAFERIPKGNIESPRSMLYCKMRDVVGDTPFYMISTVCKLCFTLRTKVPCPEGAEEAMVKSCRLFQCANYNCLVTAIVLRDPKPQIYATVLDDSYWCKLIGDEEYDLPIREQWRQRVTRQAVPAALSELRTRTRTLSDVRTRMFTRTLSENPLAYDLLEEDDEVAPQELEVSDNPLNRHPCSAALSSLLSAIGGRGVNVWGGLERALCEGPLHVAWLLAQAVVNSRELLRARACALQRALLVLLGRGNHRTLNGLHVDILDTLILWQENASEHADLAIECIINTAIDNRHRPNVCWMLVDKLVKLLDIWKDARPNWTSFEKYFIDPKPDIVKVCLQILKRITKCGVQIPQLLPALMTAMEAKRCMIEVFDLFGLALAIDDKRETYIKRYLRVLEKLRKSDVAEYIKCLYYVQKGYPGCCDESNFRSITDLTPKISGREKLKCLEILSIYVATVRRDEHVVAMFDTVGLGENLHTIEGLKLMRNGLHLMDEHRRRYCVLQVADGVRRLSVKLRLVAYEILVKALELLTSRDTSEPPSKRSARDSESIILGEKDGYTRSLLEGLARGAMEGNEEIRSSVRGGVGKLLDKDLDVRFCESFYLAAMLTRTDCEVNPAAILDMFFKILRDETLKNTKLRDEPIETSFRVTTLSNVSTNIPTANDLKEEKTSGEVNVQMSLDDLLNSLLKFSQRNINAATSLITQLLKMNQRTRPGFDFATTLGASVVQSLGGTTARWAVVVAGSMTRAGRWDCDGLKQAIDELLKVTRNAEDENVCKVLDEDYRIRSLGPEQFVLGSRFDYNVTPQCSSKFSIQDLISTFGKLSDWDNLTIQQKSSIKTGLPLMWTSRENLGLCLDDLDITDGPVWLRCMVSSCRNDFDYHFKYLKDVDKWPRKLFDLSAVTETAIWKSVRDGVHMEDICLPSDIRPSDCLAEWAVRIMIRTQFLQAPERDSEGVVPSRSHALQWCVRASECGLHAQVVDCCRNITDLFESETLKWFRQRLLALRAIALENNDTESLRSTLNLAVSYTPQFIDKSSFGDVIGMNEVILTLRKDLKTLKRDHIDATMQEIQMKLQEKSDDNIYDRRVMESVCVLALSFYDQLWETNTDSSQQNDLLLHMTQGLALVTDLDLAPKNLSADVIINRLDTFEADELDDEVAEYLLDRLQYIIPSLDLISLEQLKSHIRLFKKYESHGTVKCLTGNDGVMKYKRCLNLVGDAEHLLMQYCSQCSKVLDDKTEWSRMFDEIKGNIFENPYAGPDYRVLDKFKARLYSIAEFDSTDKETKKRVLSTVQSDLMMSKRDSVSLSHVCPELTAREIGDDSLSKLLGLRPGVSVFKFEEKIPIFVDSIRRPAVLSVRLSDGTVRRYIVKRGERVRTHYAAMRLYATVRGARRTHTGYNVTPLGEDCALIEYLEDHERFRTLISSQYPIDNAVSTIARGTDSELILAPASSLRQFEAMCARVPAYVLRSAIEENSACIENFIWKKTNFLEAICDMTVFSYLCGLGDRHLENMMLSARDGGACHVDCGAVGEYGGELPPARLTRNVLAVVDARVLESRLQTAIQTLRGCPLVSSSISVAFKWMGRAFMDNLQYVTSLIKGTTLSHLVTIDVLSKSTQAYKEKYIQLLEEVFQDFDVKENYSVEEQVSSILLQCTEPRILSVTRTNWEPWI